MAKFKKQLIFLVAAVGLLSGAIAPSVASELQETANASQGDLVFVNHLESRLEIERAGGIMSGGQFVPGVAGDALMARYDEDMPVSFPAEIVPAGTGTIEFWAKFIDPPTRIGSAGIEFVVHDRPRGPGDPSYRIGVHSNNGLGGGGLTGDVGTTSNGATFGTSSGRFGNWTFADVFGDTIEDWHHYALVWDEAGLDGVDNGQRVVAVYLDGELESTIWTEPPSSSVPPLPAGSRINLLDNFHLQGSTIIDELKIWDYAKSDFNLEQDPVLTADFERGENFPKGTVTLSGTVSDDAPVRFVRIAIRDRISRAWLQDDMATWGGFNRFEAVLDDPTSPTTRWSVDVDLNEGTYAVSVRARSHDYRWGHIRPWLRFDVGDDVTPPQIRADFAHGAEFTSPVRLSGNATDDQSLVMIRVAIRDRSTGLWLQDDLVTWGDFNRFLTDVVGHGPGDLDWLLTVDLPPGDYALSARAIDRLGNEQSLRPRRHFSVVP